MVITHVTQSIGEISPEDYYAFKSYHSRKTGKRLDRTSRISYDGFVLSS